MAVASWSTHFRDMIILFSSLHFNFNLLSYIWPSVVFNDECSNAKRSLLFVRFGRHNYQIKTRFLWIQRREELRSCSAELCSSWWRFGGDERSKLLQSTANNCQRQWNNVSIFQWCKSNCYSVLRPVKYICITILQNWWGMDRSILEQEQQIHLDWSFNNWLDNCR